jgi:hypothetical protein
VIAVTVAASAGATAKAAMIVAAAMLRPWATHRARMEAQHDGFNWFGW